MELSEKIRSRFPNFSIVHKHELSRDGLSEGEREYHFSSQQKDYANLSLSSSILSLRVGQYTSYDDFRKLAEFVSESIIPLLDTEFLTRIGFRVVNAIKIPSGEPLDGFVRQSLLNPLEFPVLGTLSSSRFEIRGFLDDASGYTFSYGTEQQTRHDENRGLSFMLDWDYYKSDIGVEEIFDLLDGYHKVHFDFFWWSLGEKSKDILIGEG